MRLQRQSLAKQALTAIRKKIEEGDWSEWLPSERDLCEQFQVSRTTLRAALQQLKQEDIIQSTRGSGTRIIRRPRSTNGGKRNADTRQTVGMLLPQAPSHLRPYILLLEDELKSMLHEAGCTLHLHINKRFFQEDNGRALEILVNQHNHGCWVVALTGRNIIDWFINHNLPCVATFFVGNLAPSVRTDTYAMLYHAASQMIAKGHQRIAMSTDISPLEYKGPAINGFLDGVEATGRTDIKAEIFYHQSLVEDVRKDWLRMMRQQNYPTAVMILNPLNYLYVSSMLLSEGWRIPDNISLMTTFGDPFLRHVYPEPTRYDNQSHQLARRLCEQILALLKGSSVRRSQINIMPDFIKGASLGPPPT